MKRDNFYKDSITLTISNLATGILGFMFAIVLSRTLGPEGMGVYGLVMPIYNLFICLISGGMVAALSKISALYFSKNDSKNLSKTVKICLSFDLIWGLIIAIIVFLSSSFIGTNIIKDTRTINAIKAICPAMIFVALSSILKGYFYGISKVKIPAFIDIIEKGIRISLIIFIVKMLSTTSLSSTVTIAYIVLGAGELSSLILLSIFYKASTHNLSNVIYKVENRAQLLFDVLVISLPLCLNGFLTTALSTVSTLIIPRRLVSAGIVYSAALSMIGKFNGMALSITFFPMIVIGSINTLLIPDLSQNLSKKDYFTLENRIADVLKIAFLLGLTTTVICFCIPSSLGKMFFNREDLGAYIKFAAVSAPITYAAVTTYGILNGLGKQGVLLRNSLIIAVEEVVLLYILTGIPSINIYGYGISLIITSFTTLLLNLYEIQKKCFLDLSLGELFIYILFSLLLFFLLTIIKHILPVNRMVFTNVIIILLGFSFFFLSLKLINNKTRT